MQNLKSLDVSAVFESGPQRPARRYLAERSGTAHDDDVYFDAVNARRIPDPITAGDFYRPFQPHDVRTLLDVFNETRLKVWARQPATFFAEGRIDMDCTLVPTSGECKAGMEIAY